MTPEKLSEQLISVLDENKATDIQVFNVSELTIITDYMIIASGRSDRQVKALADKVIEKAKKLGIRPLGVEGEKQGEWILVDLGDVILHLMRPATRVYYQLEKLWSVEDRNVTTPAV